MNGSNADSTSEAEPTTGDVYASHKHIEAQCGHNGKVEVRAVPAQSSKEHGGRLLLPLMKGDCSL